MLYTICNKFGEPKENTAKISSLDAKLTKVQDFSLQSKDGHPIGGFLLTFGGGIYYAILEGENRAPVTPDEDTNDEIVIPEDISSD